MSRFELALRYLVACLGHQGNRSSSLHKFLNISTFRGIELMLRKWEEASFQSFSDFLWSSPDSELKMADELTSVIEMFHSFKKSGRSATLTMSTKGGQATKVKLEVELDDATPPSSSPSSTSTSTAPSLPGCQATGDRHRPHGSARKRAKANARAAQHRIFQALPFPEGFSDAQSLPGQILGYLR